MDKADDQKRYFIFASAVWEVVTPILRQKLRDHYTGKGFTDFQAFINHQPICHILFHLRYKNKYCCTDRPNCYNHSQPPLTFYQWNQLYSTNTSPTCGRSCHCKYTANGVDLDAIDLTLVSLLVLEVCGLSQDEIKAVKELRHFKNNFLSHTITGCIKKDKFDNLWKDLLANTLILGPTKEDDLIRILNRPLDARLCEKYRIELMEVHKKLDEIVQQLTHVTEQNQRIEHIERLLQSIIQGLKDSKDLTAKNKTPSPPYRPGQDVFCPYYKEIDPRTLGGIQFSGRIFDILITNVDKIVMCLHEKKSLLVCNSDESNAYTIQLEGKPWSVTTINDSTVAVTLLNNQTVVVYDINRRVKIKAIPIPGQCGGITAINNRLVVGGKEEIWMVDLQTGKVINTIKTDEWSWRLHTSGDRFFSCHFKLPYLTCYNQFGEKPFPTISLPSNIKDLTSLEDGSLYVTCHDSQVYHISSDLQKYEHVQTEGLKTGCLIKYNQNRQKLLLGERWSEIIKIFHPC